MSKAALALTSVASAAVGIILYKNVPFVAKWSDTIGDKLTKIFEQAKERCATKPETKEEPKADTAATDGEPAAA